MFKKTSNCIIWIWNISEGFRIRILISSVIGALTTFTSLFFVWTCKRLVDIATGHYEGDLSTCILLMCVCIAVQLSFSAVVRRFNGRNAICLRNKMQYAFFRHLMTSEWSGKDIFHSADVVSRLIGDVRIVSDFTSLVLPSMFMTIMQLTSAFIFMLLLDARLAWIILLIMPVALLASRKFFERTRKLTKEIRAEESHLQGFVQENIQNRILISSFRRISDVMNRLSLEQKQLYAQTMERIDLSILSRSVVRSGFAVGYALAFIWGIMGLHEGSVTFGMITAFLQLVIQIQKPAVEMGRSASMFVNALASVERLEEINNLPVEEDGQIELIGDVGIRLKSVSFSYPKESRLVIKEMTYDFKPGSFTVIVGETGVGKSTLVRLILSILFPQSGTITLYTDEVEVPVSPAKRCNLIYIPQGNTLMSGTVRENLLLGNTGATDGELREALYTAHAEFVYELPGGVDTMCGEKGNGLSEGQAQRIAIARGVLCKGSILLLDEPSSSLDSETERVLLSRLTTRLVNKTIIMVTHHQLDIERKVGVLRLVRK